MVWTKFISILTSVPFTFCNYCYFNPLPKHKGVNFSKFKAFVHKRAKMALDCSPDFLRLLLPIFFFFVAFRKEFTRISLCLYSARSLHSLIPLTDQNFKNNSEKGHSRNISMRLFQNLTNSFREDFWWFCLCSYSQVAPKHQSLVHGQIKISLTFLRERGHFRNISVNWELDATNSVVLID